MLPRVSSMSSVQMWPLLDEFETFLNEKVLVSS